MTSSNVEFYRLANSANNNLLTTFGLALPWVCFIICPTKKPNARSLPFLNEVIESGLLSNTSVIIGVNLAGSDNCTKPLASTHCLGSVSLVIISWKTFFAILEEIVPQYH